MSRTDSLVESVTCGEIQLEEESGNLNKKRRVARREELESSPAQETYSPKGNGKDGMDVWPADVEDAFFAGTSPLSLCHTELMSWDSFSYHSSAGQEENCRERETLRTERVDLGLHSTQDEQGALEEASLVAYPGAQEPQAERRSLYALAPR